MTDLTTLTLDELTALRDDVINEIERRDRRERTPALLAEQAARFLEDGGTAADLQAALDPVLDT